jgi:pimeloyl-ACP methyl ester carboxylesterase
VEGTVQSADGVAVRFEVHGGGGPALVFVHGWSCDRTYWLGQVNHFAERYRVVAVDLAGHGESGLDRPAWTMASFGDDVVAVVDHLGLAETVLIGHSMGGDVIVEAARRLPGRVAGLVWVDVYSTLGEAALDETAVAEFVAPFRADFVTATRDFVRGMFLPSSSADLVEFVAADMSAAPPHIALDAIRHAVSNEPAVTAGLRGLALPTVAINPDNGHTDVEALRRYGVQTVLMAGVGHFLMMEDPQTFNRLLEEAVMAWLR